MLIHLLTAVFGQDFWGISADFLIPSSLTDSLYTTYPIWKTILSIQIKNAVAYSLGALLSTLAFISFINMILNNK
jgi:hypothetical protein